MAKKPAKKKPCNCTDATGKYPGKRVSGWNYVQLAPKVWLVVAETTNKRALLRTGGPPGGCPAGCTCTKIDDTKWLIQC